MSYCKIGQTATVDYSFADTQHKYVTNQSPIDVSVVPDLPNGQCLGLPYRIKFWFIGVHGAYGTAGWLTNQNRSFNKPITSNPIYGAIYQIGVGKISDSFFLNVLCHGTASVKSLANSCWILDPFFSTPTWAKPFEVMGTTQTVSDITGCEIIDIFPDTQTAENYNLCTKHDYAQYCGRLVKLEVKKNGITIFSDRGREPCNFTVTCTGEKCPPETCCECDCGDVICCYGSQGQLLKTIRK